MNTCPACSAKVSGSSKFCSECGHGLSSENQSTRAFLAEAGMQLPEDDVTTSPSSLSDSSDHGRFLPGAKIAGRYRVVSIIGRGGMGEVYRADDLKLGHPVALKFLPQDLTDDQQRLASFHNEVRLSRQVSHPNVCRVYDIGEVDGQHFLSMEYIDGEDLKVLLRRIGRLPRRKGIEIARQLSFGLAAAHGKGVLHRDLKPANVMIDGRGHARITDFGLATMAEEQQTGMERAGTPAYMAPEQLAHGETMIQSDLYSYGLILYELFTGQRVHQAGSMEELIRAHQDSSLTKPSSLVDNMDPTVERVILRCLEREPHQRPSSAAAVAAALPGGDALAMALAAGETPSPEMVANAGDEGRLSPVIARIGVGLVFLMMVAITFLCGKFSLVGQVPLEKPPEALAVEAREILASLGYTDKPVDRAWGFAYDRGQIDHVRSQIRKGGRTQIHQ